MTTAELAVSESEALKEWQALNNASTFTRPNEIRLVNSIMDGEEKNPDYGKLFASYIGEDDLEYREEITLAEANFKFIASKIQIKCAKFDDNGPLVKVSGEIDDTRIEYITVTPTDGADVATGLYKEMAEQFPLKYTENVYVEWKGKVYRWNLTGAHFDSWFKVKNLLKKRPSILTVTGLKDEKTGTNVYKSLVFAVGAAYSPVEAVALRRELENVFNRPKRVEDTPEPEAPKELTKGEKLMKSAEAKETPDDLPW